MEKRKMNLQKAIIFVLLGIIYTIVLKTGASLFPRLTEPIWMAETTQVFSLLASLSFIFFGVYFIKESIGHKNDRLKTALYLAFLGPVYIILIRIENIIRISPKLSLYLNDFSPNLYNLIIAGDYRIFSQFILWLGAIFIFYFFYLLYRNLDQVNNSLKKATLLMLIGAALNIVIRTAGSFAYILYPDPNQMNTLLQSIHLTGFLSYIFVSIVSLNFFWSLFKTENYNSIISTKV
jgi:hypothetical protein